MRKLILVLCIVLIFTISGCSPAKKNTANSTKTNSEKTEKVTPTGKNDKKVEDKKVEDKKEETKTESKDVKLNKEYQEIADKINKSIETGYSYSAFFNTITRKGDKLKWDGTVNGDGGVIIGEKGKKVYDITLKKNKVTEKAEADYDKLFGEVSGGDMLWDYSMRLIGQMAAASGDKKYKENAHSTLVITDIKIENGKSQSGKDAKIITVSSYPEQSKDDAGTEVYVILDSGLLESYSLSTPILNKGKVAKTEFKKLTPGPISDDVFSLLN